MLRHPVLVYAVAAGLVFGLLRLSRLRPSRFSTVVLALLGIGYPAYVHLVGRRFSPLDLLYVVSEPWLSAREALRIERTSAGITGDLWQLFAPWAAAVRASWEAGVWPLWTSNYLSGTVLLGAGQSAPFAPDQLLMLACSFEDGFTVAAAFVLLAAAVGAFLYARELGLAEEAALVAAACWAFSSYHFFWLGWRHGAAGGLFPLVLLGIRRSARTPNGGTILLLSAAFALVALCGHPETLLHVTVAAGVVLLFELLSLRPKLDARRMTKRVAAVGLSGLLAFALSAVALVPVLDVLPQAHDWHKRQTWAARDRPLPDLARSGEAAAGSFVPFVSGVWGKENPKGDLPAEPFSTGYIGSLGFALAVVGLVASRRRLRWAMLALALGALAAASGFAPVEYLLRKLPLLDVAFNGRLVFVTGVAFSILAALGFEVLIRTRSVPAEPQRRDERVRAVAIARYLPVVAACAIGLLWAPLVERGLSDRFLREQAMLFVAPLLLLPLLLPLERRARLAAVLVITALVAQRLGESSHFHAGAMREAFELRVAPLAELPAVAPAPYRVVGVGNRLYPNSAALVGLADVRGYEAVHLARYVDTLPLWAVDERVVPFVTVESLESPFLDFLAVRWALDGPGGEPPPGWSVASDSGRPWRLLENHDALQLAFLPAEVRRGESSKSAIAEMATAESFGAVSWIEPGDDGDLFATGANARGEIAIAERAPGRYRLRATLDREGWIATSIPFWRGWRATAAGRELETAFANHAFVAIRAPAGASEIDLAYSPTAFRVGLWTSALAVSVWLGLFCRWVATRNRSAIATDSAAPAAG